MSDLLILFNSIDLNGRAQLVWEHGDFEVSREYYGNKVSLYSMPEFHVEVYYHPKDNQIIKIEAITDNEGLNKFLPYIELK